MDPFTIAAAGASIINPIAQGIQNRKQRKWNEAMMNQQRQWALQDWNMQNEYNSPTAQMERLKAAGLNPHLMYGKGDVGNAQSIARTDSKSWNPTAPQVNTAGIQEAYFNTQIKEQQVDLLKKEQTIKVNEAALKAAMTANNLARTAKTQFDLKLAEDLKKYSLQAAEQNVRKLTVGTDIMEGDYALRLKRYELDAALNASNLREATERILTMRVGREKARAEIRNLDKDGQLKQLDIQLKQNGVQPTDALWQRVLSQVLSQSGAIQDVKSFYKKAEAEQYRLLDSIKNSRNK